MMLTAHTRNDYVAWTRAEPLTCQLPDLAIGMFKKIQSYLEGYGQAK